MRLVVFLAIVTGLVATAEAQQVYCALQVERGSLWIDYVPIRVRNLGTGVAVGIQVVKSFPVAAPAPPFGTSGVTMATLNLGMIERLEPGEEATVKEIVGARVSLPPEAPGTSYSATPSACLSR
jgi:hypothetical protein